MAFYPSEIKWSCGSDGNGDTYYVPIGGFMGEEERTVCTYTDAQGVVHEVKARYEYYLLATDHGPHIGQNFGGDIQVVTITAPSTHPDYNTPEIYWSFSACDISDEPVVCDGFDNTNTDRDQMENFVFGDCASARNRWPTKLNIPRTDLKTPCDGAEQMKVVLDNGNFGKLTFIDVRGCYREIPIICGRKNGTASAPNGYYSFDPKIGYHAGKSGFGGNGAYAGPFTGEAADELCGKDGLLFHNDGGGMGTNGCIGIQQPYWDEWEQCFKEFSDRCGGKRMTFSISNAVGNVRTANKVNEDGSIRPDCFIRYNANGSITVGKKVAR